MLDTSSVVTAQVNSKGGAWREWEHVAEFSRRGDPVYGSDDYRKGEQRAGAHG